MEEEDSGLAQVWARNAVSEVVATPLRRADSSEFGTFPTPPSQTVQAPFDAHGFPGRWLHLSWALAASTAPVGLSPPSPVALHPVLDITPCIRLLRPLCHHEPDGFYVVPKFPSCPAP